MSFINRLHVGDLKPSKPHNNFTIQLKVWFIKLLFERCKGLEDHEKVFAGLFYRTDLSKSFKSYPMLEVSVTIPKPKPIRPKELFDFTVFELFENRREARQR